MILFKQPRIFLSLNIAPKEGTRICFINILLEDHQKLENQDIFSFEFVGVTESPLFFHSAVAGLTLLLFSSLQSMLRSSVGGNTKLVIARV